MSKTFKISNQDLLVQCKTNIKTQIFHRPLKISRDLQEVRKEAFETARAVFSRLDALLLPSQECLSTVG